MDDQPPADDVDAPAMNLPTYTGGLTADRTVILTDKDATPDAEGGCKWCKCCCECCWNCCRTWPVASFLWLLMFQSGAGWALSSSERVTHVSGITDLQDMVETYFIIAEVVMFYALAFAFISTGKCGEKVADFTGDVVYGGKPCCNYQSKHTYCARVCMGWFLWGSCCFLQWSGSLAIYGIIVSLALLIYACGM